MNVYYTIIIFVDGSNKDIISFDPIYIASEFLFGIRFEWYIWHNLLNSLFIYLMSIFINFLIYWVSHVRVNQLCIFFSFYLIWTLFLLKKIFCIYLWQKQLDSVESKTICESKILIIKDKIKFDIFISNNLINRSSLEYFRKQ